MYLNVGRRQQQDRRFRWLWIAGPEEAEAGGYAGEVFVAGGQGSLAAGGQGGGEAAEVGEFVMGVEFGGLLGEAVGGGNEVDGELGDFGDYFLGGSGALGAVDGIVDFAPVNYAHQEFGLALGGAGDQGFDGLGAGAVFEEVHQGAGVEDYALGR